MAHDYSPALRAALDAATRAGALLHDEFRRPDGPRGELGKCPADNEAEELIRAALDAFAPDYGVVAEEYPERNRPASDPEHHVWLVDPNDGTSHMQRGHRGAAVSIGLLRDGVPVLGVVYAYAARAGRGDLISWAEGLEVTRNGSPVRRAPWGEVTHEDTVLVSPAAERAPAPNARACAPARFRTVASPAYRLALLAVGEGVAATCLGGPDSYDVAAGHALLHGVGGELYRSGGEPVRYRRDGSAEVGDFAAGHPEFARTLALQQGLWSSSDGSAQVVPPPRLRPDLGLVKPDARVTVADPGLLDRAQGVLAGQLAGDALGSLVEFETPEAIRNGYGETGPQRLVDGGTFDTLAGQPTDDSEMALVLARTLLRDGGYDPEQVARGYAAWARSGPFDMGGTTAHALHPAAAAASQGRGAAPAARAAAREHQSQANGALMRISPLAVFGHRLPAADLAALARADATLTHAHPVCQDANAVYCVAVAAAVRDGHDARSSYELALRWAESAQLAEPVREALRAAVSGPPADYLHHQGWVLTALRNAFHQLLTAPTAADGVRDTVRRGGDTDTNAAIAGALLGAVHGADSLPAQWRDRLVTCRALETPQDRAWVTSHPRPACFWPVDHQVLAEGLAFAAPRQI